jgi:hypothetical protein
MSILIPQPLFRHAHLVVAPCKFGHGVFTTGLIPSGATVEECPYLRIRKEDCSGIIDDYVYGLESDNGNSGEDPDYYSLPLGWGSIYNHANDHNTEYWHDVDRDLIVFVAAKDIAAGEQLFINYGEPWWETRELEPDDPE